MTINNEQFEKGLKGLRRVSMTPKEQGVLFSKLLQYTNSNAAPVGAFWTTILRAVKSVIPVSWK